MRRSRPKGMFIPLDELPMYGVDVSPGELIQWVRARLFPDPISFDPLAWAEDEILAHLHPDPSIHYHGFGDDDGPIEL